MSSNLPDCRWPNGSNRVTLLLKRPPAIWPAGKRPPPSDDPTGDAGAFVLYKRNCPYAGVSNEHSRAVRDGPDADRTVCVGPPPATARPLSPTTTSAAPTALRQPAALAPNRLARCRNGVSLPGAVGRSLSPPSNRALRVLLNSQVLLRARPYGRISPAPLPAGFARASTVFNRLPGERIGYLRIGLTDACNLRCVYCMPEQMTFRPRGRVR
jgi:hypothetical protein